jgi:PAS domain S-box-containing protein
MVLKNDWRVWIVLILGLLTSVLVIFFVKNEIDKNNLAEFEFESNNISNKIKSRLHANTLLLKSGTAYLSTSDEVDIKEWQNYIKNINIEKELPGTLSVGYSIILTKENLAQHALFFDKLGITKPISLPNPNDDTLSSIIMLEPFNKNSSKVLGYDMMTEPIRKKAMERARDLNTPSLSGKVRLVQEPDIHTQAGCLIYVPLYKKNLPINTVEQRRTAIKGWVYSPFRMNDLVSNILNMEFKNNYTQTLHLTIYDGLECTDKSLMYSSFNRSDPKSLWDNQYVLKNNIDFYGHQWTLLFEQKKDNLIVAYFSAWIVAIMGSIISILLMLLTSSLLGTKQKARNIADELTKELKHNEKLLKESQQIANLGSYTYSINTGTWTNSDILDGILGMNKSTNLNMLDWLDFIHQDDRKEIESYLNKVINEKIFFNKVYRIIKLNTQEECWVHGLGKLEFDNMNNPIKLIGTIRDITEQKNAEKRLILHRKKYQSLFVNSPLGIYKATKDGYITEANPALLEMLEFDSLKELQIRSLSKKEYSQEFAVSRTLFSQMISLDGHVKGLEGTWKTKNGKIIHIRVNARVTRDLNTKDIFYEGTIEDITDKKQAEKEIHDITNRLQLATQAAKIGIWDNDLITKTSIWDQTMFRLFGYKNNEKLNPDTVWHKAITLKERERIHKEILLALDGKNEYNIEFSITWPDNSVHLLKGFGKVTYDENGKPLRMVGVNIDITEQRLAEKIIKKQHIELEEKVAERTLELTISEKKLTQSLKQITDYKFALDESSIVAVTDNKGVITYVNTLFCKISKYKKEELLGNTHSLVNSGYHSADVFVDLWKTISAGKVWRGELKNKAKDGTFYWVDSTIVPFMNENGKPYQFIAIRFDITYKKQAEKALLKAKEDAVSANQAKSEFLANMSHEIRTPMNSVIGFSELLSRSIKNEKQLSQVKSIQSSGKTLLKIIDDILDLSKIEANKVEINTSPIQLHSLMAEIENMFIFKADEKDLHFLIEYESPIPQIVYIDEIRVRQVLFNLIGNAIKFTDKGSVIVTVDTCWKYDKIDLIFRIKDSGIGIPVDQQKAIFDPFTQQKNQSAKYGGTGLGLSITKKLIEKMNGHIELESEVGNGSNFTVVLPNIKVSKKEDAPVEEPFKYHQTEFEKGTILVADDNIENRKLIKALLDEFPLKIYEAINGEEAVSIAKKIVPNLILMDLRMPIMDGYEATEILKTNQTTLSIPIIAVSASSSKVIHSGRTKNIFDEYILKPFDANDLVEKMKKYISFKHVENINHSEVKEKLPITKENQIKLIGLVKILESQFIPMCNQALKSQIIDDIANFGEQLRIIALEYEIDYLADYASKICEYSDNFEIDKLTTLMKNFNFIIEHIK